MLLAAVYLLVATVEGLSKSRWQRVPVGDVQPEGWLKLQMTLSLRCGERKKGVIYYRKFGSLLLIPSYFDLFCCFANVFHVARFLLAHFIIINQPTEVKTYTGYHRIQ